MPSKRCPVCVGDENALVKLYRLMPNGQFHKLLCKKHGDQFIALVCDKILKNMEERDNV
jgi:hypothetical protein